MTVPKSGSFGDTAQVSFTMLQQWCALLLLHLSLESHYSDAANNARDYEKGLEKCGEFGNHRDGYGTCGSRGCEPARTHRWFASKAYRVSAFPDPVLHLCPQCGSGSSFGKQLLFG